MTVVGVGYYAGNGGGAALIICALAPSDQAACDTITADFIATYARYVAARVK
jgi:hypothetical protein